MLNVRSLLYWGAFGFLAGVVAISTGLSGCAWFVVGLLLGPFGLLIAILLPPRNS
jgi:hypothetical protein